MRRFGLLLGASYPVGALIAAAGLLFTSGSAVQLAFVVPGVIIGGFGWLALPVWPLVLARRVFNKPHRTSPTRKEPHRTRRPGRDHPDRLPNVTVIHHDTGEVLSEHATQTAATGATNTNNLADGQSQYER